MDYFKIEAKAVEIAELIFQKEELLISRVEFSDVLGKQFEDYEDIIRDAICSNEKLDRKKGRTGGITFVPKKHRQTKLSDRDIKQIKDSLKKLYKDFLEQASKEKRARPEKEIEDAFKKWIEKEIKDGDNQLFGPKAIVNFRSNARRGSKWKNVDGYVVELKELKYHLQVKPILTSFEVKAGLPAIDGFLQAKNYLDFSHHSYLVFKFEGDEKELKSELGRSGNGLNGVGLFFTKDGVNFIRYEESKPERVPSEIEVDEALDILLAEDDKERLLKIKYDHLVNEMLVPAIS